MKIFEVHVCDTMTPNAMGKGPGPKHSKGLGDVKSVLPTSRCHLDTGPNSEHNGASLRLTMWALSPSSSPWTAPAMTHLAAPHPVPSVAGKDDVKSIHLP